MNPKSTKEPKESAPEAQPQHNPKLASDWYKLIEKYPKHAATLAASCGRKLATAESERDELAVNCEEWSTKFADKCAELERVKGQLERFKKINEIIKHHHEKVMGEIRDIVGYKHGSDAESVEKVKQIKHSNARLLAALKRASEDINWMLNNRQFLNGDCFDYSAARKKLKAVTGEGNAPKGKLYWQGSHSLCLHKNRTSCRAHHQRYFHSPVYLTDEQFENSNYKKCQRCRP